MFLARPEIEVCARLWPKHKSLQTPLKNNIGNWYKSDKEQSETFRSYFAEVFQQYNTIGNYNFIKHVENALISHLSFYLAPKPFSPGEVQCFIKYFPLK